MVNGNIEISDPKILDDIRTQRFGAVIGVMNSHHSTKYKKWKRRQVRVSRQYLERALGDDCRIWGGVFVLHDDGKTLDEDFHVRVNNYADDLLEDAAREALTGMQWQDAHELEAILDRCEEDRFDSALREILTLQHYCPKDVMRKDRAAYDRRFGRIKDDVFTMYVRNLLQDGTSPDSICLRPTIKPKNGVYVAKCDMIVAATQSDFKDSLRYIADNYPSGRTKVTLEYPREENAARKAHRKQRRHAVRGRDAAGMRY